MRVKNWTKFQHYKNRQPRWIKLYRDLLDDPDWHALDGESAKALVMLWLIASETDGVLPEPRKLCFRLRISENNLNAMLSKLSHWFEHDDSAPLATAYQDACPEESKRRVEKEGEKEKECAFDAFWIAYPRKIDKQYAHRVFMKADLILADILAGIEIWKHSEEWREERFIPHPATFLNRQRWKYSPVKTRQESMSEQFNRDFEAAVKRVEPNLREKDRLGSNVRMGPPILKNAGRHSC